MHFFFRCDIIIHVFENASKISVQDDICDCGAQMVSIEYKEDKTKLPNDQTEMTGCVFCSLEFGNLVEKHKAIFNRRRGNYSANPNPRAKGRRKPRPPKDKMSQLAAYFV